ncbi:MAG: coproporphyrinogen dehydrogenase HemZ [Lachnospiraceae bacterium]|nr:coproporphyrinogen dehydrogenase HemZ [Lachnospiraceae bacterium]
MKVSLNDSSFSYDVHSLVKAFYPDEDVSVSAEDGGFITVDVYGSAAEVTAGSIKHTGQLADPKRPEMKNLLKRTLYGALLELTGKDLPWGTMTGIRPVKVPMKLIREGADDERIFSYMKSVYLCSDEKIRLAMQIAHRESGIIDSLNPGGFCLYIGIPFCPTTCMYCSFTSYPIASWADRTGEYLSALRRELDFFSGHFAGRRADAVYIGGGTPTTLSPDELSWLMGYIRDSFDLSAVKEFTVEAGRPDSITDEKLAAIREGGADRISINPQTMNEETLRIIGRRHTTEDTVTAFEKARRAGFSNINMDIILGLPGEDEKMLANTLKSVKDLGPDSLTVHSMAIKRAAHMHDYLRKAGISSVNTPEMMHMADECAASMGMSPYYLYRQKNMSGNFENVGYALSGCFGIYNIAIMEEVCDIAAAGAGTISKRVFSGDRIERCDSVKDVDLYISRIDEMIERKKKLFKGE